MNRMNALTARRREDRHAQASASVAAILPAAAADGITIDVIGSLARGDFRAHSDIDLLVRGTIEKITRQTVERLVADHLRHTGIPYDLIFAEDLTEDRLQELLDDGV